MKTYIMLALCAVTIGSSHHTIAMEEDDPQSNIPTLIQAKNTINDAPEDDTAPPSKASETAKRKKQDLYYKALLEKINTIKD